MDYVYARHLRLRYSRFCMFDSFKKRSRLQSSRREVDSKVLRMAISYEVFYKKKKQHRNRK